MENFKSAFGLIRAVMPVLYFGGLFTYFFDVSGSSIANANMIGLGPTLVGLLAVGLLFCIPLAIRIVRILNGPRAPGSGPGRPAPDGEDGFDADAVVARYMAQRPAEPIPSAPVPRPASKSGEPTRPTGFGRRIKLIGRHGNGSNSREQRAFRWNPLLTLRQAQGEELSQSFHAGRTTLSLTTVEA